MTPARSPRAGLDQAPVVSLEPLGQLDPPRKQALPRISSGGSFLSASPSRMAGEASCVFSENDFTKFRHTWKTASRSTTFCRVFENAIVSRL